VDNKCKKKCSSFLTIKKCKSEVYCNSISPQSEWLSSRKQTTTNAGQDEKKKEALLTGWESKFV
jgi:hypothetical protein